LPKHRPPPHRAERSETAWSEATAPKGAGRLAGSNTAFSPLFPRNPLFPALRSGPTAGSGASPKKQIPSSNPKAAPSTKGRAATSDSPCAIPPAHYFYDTGCALAAVEKPGDRFLEKKELESRVADSCLSLASESAILH